MTGQVCMQHDRDLVGDVVAEAEHVQRDVVLDRQPDHKQHARPLPEAAPVQQPGSHSHRTWWHRYEVSGLSHCRLGGGRGIISRSVRMVAVVQVMVGLSQLLWGFWVGLVIEGQKFPSRAQESAFTFCLSVTEVNPSRTECSSVSPASSACHLSGTLSFSLEV